MADDDKTCSEEVYQVFYCLTDFYSKNEIKNDPIFYKITKKMTHTDLPINDFKITKNIYTSFGLE